jgi:hypothetical protein
MIVLDFDRLMEAIAGALQIEQTGLFGKPLTYASQLTGADVLMPC